MGSRGARTPSGISRSVDVDGATGDGRRAQTLHDRARVLVVADRLDRRTTIAQNLARYEQFEEPIAPAIGMRTSFAYAFDHGQWVGDYAPGTPAHHEIQQLVDAIDCVAIG